MKVTGIKSGRDVIQYWRAE